MTAYPQRGHLPRPHLNPWGIAVVVLAAALVGLGAWTIIDHTGAAAPSTSGPSTGFASGSSGKEATRIIDDLNTAVNRGDAGAVRQLLARNVVFELPNGDRLSGIDKVLNVVLIPHASGLHLRRVGAVASTRNEAAAFIETEAGIELTRWQFANGKIVGQQVYSP